MRQWRQSCHHNSTEFTVTDLCRRSTVSYNSDRHSDGPPTSCHRKCGHNNGCLATGPLSSRSRSSGSCVCVGRCQHMLPVPELQGSPQQRRPCSWGLPWTGHHNLKNMSRVTRWSHSRTAKNITVTSQWVWWRLKSPASRLFTQPFIKVPIKESIIAPRHWPLCGEFTGDRWIPHTNGQ